jgi:hypothetical protein
VDAIPFYSVPIRFLFASQGQVGSGVGARRLGPTITVSKATAKVENGRDKSRSVRNRIPYFSVRFRFSRDKRKRDRKRDGVKRERDRKRWSVCPSVFAESRFRPGYPVFLQSGIGCMERRSRIALVWPETKLIPGG